MVKTKLQKESGRFNYLPTLIFYRTTVKLNRFYVLDGVIKAISKNKDWRKRGINNQLEKFINKDKENKFPPYCGIVIWYLRKKLHQ